MRLPEDWAGVGGQDRRHVQRRGGAEPAHHAELERLSRVVGKEGKLDAARAARRRERRLGAVDGVRQRLIADLVHPPARPPA